MVVFIKCRSGKVADVLEKIDALGFVLIRQSNHDPDLIIGTIPDAQRPTLDPIHEIISVWDNIKVDPSRI